MRRCFLIIILLLSSSTANAQHWKMIGTFHDNCWPYFINEQVGFIYGYGHYGNADGIALSATPYLMKTTDGGGTWSTMATGTMSGMITCMHFVSLRHGYASTQPQFARYSDPGGGIFETLDGGNSWRQISPNGFSFIGVYSDGVRVIGTPTMSLLQSGAHQQDGISFSPDDGVTWQLEANALSWSFFVLGNGDGTVITGSFPQSAGGALSTSFSTDAGQNWSTRIRTSVYDFQNWEQYLLPHSQIIVRPFEEADSGSPINRSSDLGQTWSTAYRELAEDELAGSVDGSGCIVYVQRVHTEFLRSDDKGLTWHPVGGPASGGYGSHLFTVVGNGAVVYALQPTGELWKTTDGGDGTLSPTIPYQITLSHSLGTIRQDTLIVSECDSTKFMTTFTYASCDHAKLDTLRIDGLSQSVYQSTIRQIGIPPDEHDTAFTTIKGAAPGVYPLTIHAIYRHDEQLIGDTTYQFTLVVKKSPAILSITRKDTIDFGPQALCASKLKRDSLSIRNLGCEALQVDSVWMVSDQATNDFSFTGGSALVLTRSDSAKLFRYSFKPSQAIKESARIFIKTSLGIDTIYLKGEGTADQKRVALRGDTVRSSVCDSVDAVLTLLNTSCRLMAIDSLVLPPPVYLLPGQLPLGLSSGQSQDINIRFVPSVAGQSTIQFKAVMRFIVGTDTSRYDTLLTLPITAKAGTPSITALDSSVDLGKISTCATTDATIHFASTGCDTLRVSGEQLSGLANGFSILDGHAATLSVHRLDSIKVHFAPPGVGKFASDIIISTAAGNKTVHVKAEGVPDSGRVALSSTALNLGSVTAVCDSSASSFVFKNTTCNPITVDSLSAASRPFVSDVLLRSKTLATDSSVRFGVQFFPDQVGAFSSSIKLYYHGVDKIEHDTLIALQGSGRAGVTLGTELQAATLSTQAGQPSVVPVFITGALDQASAKTLGLRWVDLTLAWNTDLLSPTGITTPIIGASIGNVKMMKGIISFRVTLLSGFTFSTPTQIATINCKAFVTDTMTTEAEIIASGFNSAGACVSIAGSSGKVKFTLAPICSDPTLSKYMAHSLPFAIRSIIPNPTSGKLTIEISGQTHPHYDLFDVLGHAMLTGELMNAQLDLHSLPNGSYYLRLSSDGYAETRKIVKK
jgi:hypothetical protein